MSMQTSICYGYGFHTDCEPKALLGFIKNHETAFCKSETEKELFQKLLSCDVDSWRPEDDLEGYPCDTNGTEGVGAVVANIMSRETGIRFDYCGPDGDCDTYAAVLFAPAYPWEQNEVEKGLTEEQLKSICKKYAKELETEEDPDYLAQEYYG